MCDWKGEATVGGFRASFFEPGGVLVRSVTTISSSAGKVRSASSIAFTGSESPTRESTSSVGAASASSSARSAASVRASSSAFVNQSSREMSEAGATTSISASSPACARTDVRRASARTEVVATTSSRRGTASGCPARRPMRTRCSGPLRRPSGEARRLRCVKSISLARLGGFAGRSSLRTLRVVTAGS